MSDASVTEGRRKPGPKPKNPVIAEIEGLKHLTDIDLPLNGGAVPQSARDKFADETARWEKINEQRNANDYLGYDGLVLEEAFRALSLQGAEARDALVRLGHVVVSAIESFDRLAKALEVAE